jgi:hypothetical protein
VRRKYEQEEKRDGNGHCAGRGLWKAQMETSDNSISAIESFGSGQSHCMVWTWSLSEAEEDQMEEVESRYDAISGATAENEMTSPRSIRE